MRDSYLVLVKEIRDAVRSKVKEITPPNFQIPCTGFIRITARPCNKKADDWLGGLSDFGSEHPDVAEYENIFTVVPSSGQPALLDRSMPVRIEVKRCVPAVVDAWGDIIASGKESYFKFYISVSYYDSTSESICASAAVPVIQNFFSDFHVNIY